MSARSAHSRLFEQLVRERRAVLLESLVSIQNPLIAGTIQGLDEAIKISEEADRKLTGEQ